MTLDLDFNPYHSYRALGWSTVPIYKRGKVPIANLLPQILDPDTQEPRHTWKPFQERYPTDDEIKLWLGRDTNISLITGQFSKIIVLDLDNAEAQEWADAQGIPETCYVQTSKGVHLYFQHPGIHVPTKANAHPTIAGIDIRGDGGMAVLPPSVHETGHIYTWIVDPLTTPPAPCPDWLLDLIHSLQPPEEPVQPSLLTDDTNPPADGDEYSDNTPRPEPTDDPDLYARRVEAYLTVVKNNTFDKLRHAAKGTRNQTLFICATTLARYIAGGYLTENEIFSDLQTVARSAGLSAAEIPPTVRSGIRAGRQKPITLDLPNRPLPTRSATPAYESDGTLADRFADTAPIPSDELAPPPLALTTPPPTPPTKPPAATPDDANGKEPPSFHILLEIGETEATFYRGRIRERFVRYALNEGEILIEDMRDTTAFFKDWLIQRHVTQTGKYPHMNQVQAAMSALESRCAKADKQAINPRLTEHEGAIYIHLANDRGEVVRVSPDGWEIITDSPVVFQVTRATRPIPTPERGGSLELFQELTPFTTLSDWQLLISWMLNALKPYPPYVHLALVGGTFSGKTTLLEMIRTFIDPNLSQHNAPPENRDDFMVAAYNNHVISFENLTEIPDWLVDFITRAASGVGITKRMLYKDTMEMVLQNANPMIITSLTPVLTDPTLALNTIQLTLPPVPSTVPPTVYALNLTNKKGVIFGAILDALVFCLQYANPDAPSSSPHINFLNWVEGATAYLGWEQGSIEALFTQTQASNTAAVTADNMITQLLIVFASGLTTDRQITLPTNKLRDELLQLKALHFPEAPQETWETGYKALSQELERARYLLQTHNICLEKGKLHSGTRQQLYVIHKST